jgi:hypothetical protein
MEFEDIEKIVDIVQLKSGAAQVLASKIKRQCLRVLSATNSKIWIKER